MADMHTSGPWAVSKNSSGRRVTTTKGIVICNAVLRNTGTAKGGLKYGGKEVAEAEANARLIAAAPELLEVAERILDRGYVSSSIEEECGDHDALVAAIAKATQP